MNLKFMNIAKLASYKSVHPKAKIGSVLVYKNRPLSIGHNSLSTHPKSNTPYFTIHAEFDCLNSFKEIKEYKSHLELYVYREIKDGTLANSKCCKYCMELVRYYNIKKVHYTIDNGYKTEVL